MARRRELWGSNGTGDGVLGLSGGWGVSFEAQAGVMECAVGRRGAGAGTRRVGKALSAGSAAIALPWLGRAKQVSPRGSGRHRAS
jgi:hypothetical protein